jgi:polysaccharide pyruvyl transferase CsaB
MDRVLVCGYCGGINVGDEAIIATLANFLSEKFDYRVAILSGDPAASRHYIGEQFEYVQSFYPRKAGAHPSLLALVPAVKSCKAVFFAGGGLIQDVHSTSLLEHITLIAELAHSLGIPVFSLGIGAGPIRTEKGKALGKRFLFANSSIYLRDEYSASYLRALYENFDYEYFKVQNDTITLLGQRERDSNNNKLIGICFRDWSGFEREWLLSICEKLAADGCKLIFMAYESVDMEIYCFLRDRLGEAIVISDESTLENSLNTIAKLDALLSMRLHANIFAMLYSVPFVALSYDEKLRSVLGRFGFGDRVLSLGCDENQVLDLLKQKTTLSTDKLSKLQSDQAAAVYGLVGDLDLHAGSGSIIKHIRVFYSWCDIYAQPVIRKFSLRFFSKFSSFLPNSMKRNLKRRLGIKW